MTMSLRRSARTAHARGLPSVAAGPVSERPTTSDEARKKPAKKSRRNTADEGTRNTAQLRGAQTPAQAPASEQRYTPASTKIIPHQTSTPPSFLGVVSGTTYGTNDQEDPTCPPTFKASSPNVPGLPVFVPGGGERAASIPDSSEVSPSRLVHEGELRPSATPGTVLSQACAHLLAVEPKMGPLVRDHECHTFSPAGLAESIDPFRSLVSGILAQQVSGAATKAINNRFIALFNDDNEPSSQYPTPAQVAGSEISLLRSAGLSQRKAEYVQGLAKKFASGELSASMLLHASDEEVMEKLIAVRGLGRWSVEMFACFTLKRMDVFSTGDLGVQRGMAAFMGKDVSKLKAKGGKWKYISEKDMVEASEKFRPYRTLFMWYMWKVEHVDVSAVWG